MRYSIPNTPTMVCGALWGLCWSALAHRHAREPLGESLMDRMWTSPPTFKPTPAPTAPTGSPTLAPTSALKLKFEIISNSLTVSNRIDYRAHSLFECMELCSRHMGWCMGGTWLTNPDMCRLGRGTPKNGQAMLDKVELCDATACQTFRWKAGSNPYLMSSTEEQHSNRTLARDACETVLCSNTCGFANDGVCDDTGTGAKWKACELGTDCADCGKRKPSHHCHAGGVGHCSSLSGHCVAPVPYQNFKGSCTDPDNAMKPNLCRCPDQMIDCYQVKFPSIYDQFPSVSPTIAPTPPPTHTPTPFRRKYFHVMSHTVQFAQRNVEKNLRTHSLHRCQTQCLLFASWCTGGTYHHHNRMCRLVHLDPASAEEKRLWGHKLGAMLDESYLSAKPCAHKCTTFVYDFHEQATGRMKAIFSPSKPPTFAPSKPPTLLSKRPTPSPTQMKALHLSFDDDAPISPNQAKYAVEERKENYVKPTPSPTRYYIPLTEHPTANPTKSPTQGVTKPYNWLGQTRPTPMPTKTPTTVRYAAEHGLLSRARVTQMFHKYMPKKSASSTEQDFGEKKLKSSKPLLHDDDHDDDGHPS